MSYFVKLPYDVKTMDDTQYAIATAPTSQAPTRVDSWPTEPGELDDNENLGYWMRFYVYAISSSPIRHALYTQKFGFGQWLSYKSATGTLGLSSTIGSNETFIVTPVSLTSFVERQIYLVSPAYYFQASYISATQNSLNPVSTVNTRCNFAWHYEIGSGPLMPGMVYYIRTLYSKALSCPVSTATTWTQSSSSTSYGIKEQVTFKPVKVVGVGGATFYSYNIVTVWDKYVSVSSTGVISFKAVGSTTPGANEEFRLLKSEFAFGKFRLLNVGTNFCLRPNSNGFDVGTVDVTYDNPEDHLDYIPAVAGPPIVDCLSADAHKRAFAAAAARPALPALVFEEGFDPAKLECKLQPTGPAEAAPEQPARAKTYAGAALEIDDEEEGAEVAAARPCFAKLSRAARIALILAFIGLMALAAQLSLSARRH